MEEIDEALYNFFDKFCYFISINPDKYKEKDSSREETYFVSEKYLLIREADEDGVGFLIYNKKNGRILNEGTTKGIISGITPEKNLESAILHFLDESKPCENYSVDETKFKNALDYILG